jgi:AcrR family transcriptional regulator
MASKSTGTLVPTHPTAQRLLDAAVRSMDTEGEAGLRVDAVVSEAGVTIPVLYHHFGSREGLVRAAHVVRLRRAMEAVLAKVELALSQVHDRQGLMDVTDMILESVGSPSEERFIRLNVLGATYGRPELQAEVAALQLEIWERMAEHFRGPQEKGWIRPDLDLVVYIGWMFGLFIGRTLVDIQEGAVDGDEWNRNTRLAMYMVLFGEPPSN